jgi:hypothetical protein
MELQNKIPCEHCGKTFFPERRWQRFCSTPCRVQAWNKRHPRQSIGQNFGVVPDEPGGTVRLQADKGNAV